MLAVLAARFYDFAPIAQWIEHQPAELGIQVRFLLGAVIDGGPILRREWAFFYTFSTMFSRVNEDIECT